MPLEQVPAYLVVRLRTVTEVEAAASVLARYRWLTHDPAERAAALAEVDAAWRARTMSDALRAASDLLGRSYARMASALWSLDLPEDAVTCRAVVVGATAAAAGLGAADTARLVGFEDVQTVVAAALKIRPFDPALGLQWAAAPAGRSSSWSRGWPTYVRSTSCPPPVHPWSRPGDRPIHTPKGGSTVPESRGRPTRALRLGVAGPVGIGKSSLIALICAQLGTELSLAVITNDIYTDEDARFLRSAGVLAPERIRAAETGACPHTAIRDDISQNLLAVEDLERDFDPVDVVLVESGGATT